MKVKAYYIFLDQVFGDILVTNVTCTYNSKNVTILRFYSRSRKTRCNTIKVGI